MLKLVRIVTLALALVVVACAGGEPAPTMIPQGTYLANSGAGNEQLKFSKNTYLIVLDGASYVQGSYISTDRQITLTTSSISQKCIGDVGPAVYSWAFKSNLLTLKKDSDACAFRTGVLQQTWQKQE